MTNVLGTLFGIKPGPVTAQQMKGLMDLVTSKMAHEDSKTANQWHDFLSFMFSVKDEDVGIVVDLLQKISHKDYSTQQEWTREFKRFLRKEKAWTGAQMPLAPLWMENTIVINKALAEPSEFFRTLSSKFTVEKTAQNLIDQLKKQGAFHSEGDPYEYVLVEPREVGYNGDVRADQFIQFILRTYRNVGEVGGELAVHIRAKYEKQPEGETILLAMEPMAPTFKQERDIFRISHYNSSIARKKKISSKPLSLAAMRIERHVDKRTKFVFQKLVS